MGRIVTVQYYGGGRDEFKVKDVEECNALVKEWVDYMQEQKPNSWHIRQFTKFPMVVIRFDLIVSISSKEDNTNTIQEEFMRTQIEFMKQHKSDEDWKNTDTDE